MDMEYRPGDIVILNTRPHNGTSYPTLLREYAESGKPVEIRDCRNDTYYISIHWNAYAVYSDEIVGLRKWVALFI